MAKRLALSKLVIGTTIVAIVIVGALLYTVYNNMTGNNPSGSKINLNWNIIIY
jgi:hypothetical protein